MTDESTAPAPEPAAPETSTPEPSNVPSTFDAISRAFDHIGWDDDGDAPEAQPDEGAGQDDSGSDARDRDENGRFKAKAKTKAADGEGGGDPAARAENKDETGAEKEGKTYDGPEAPDRFSKDAKAVWQNVPKAVKHEIERMQRETQALVQDRQVTGDLRPFVQAARSAGKTIEQALTEYGQKVHLLKSDPVRGLDAICREMYGASIQQVAERIVGAQGDQKDGERPQVPPQVRRLEDQNAALQREIAAMRQQLGGLTQHHQSQQAERQINGYVEQFAARNPRFDELATHIAGYVQQGLSLDHAYRLAAAENPPAPAPAAPADQQADQTARKASLSVSGAPPTGHPLSAPKKRSKTTAEAAEAALRAVGL